MNGSSVLNGIDLQFLFLDRIYRINGIFFRLRRETLDPKALLFEKQCKSCLIFFFFK